jgi:hypothetical protein
MCEHHHNNAHISVDSTQQHKHGDGGEITRVDGLSASGLDGLENAIDAQIALSRSGRSLGAINMAASAAHARTHE